MTSFNGDYSQYTVKGYPVRHRKKECFPPVAIRLPPEYRAIMNEIRTLDQSLDRMILGADDYLQLAEEAYASNIHWSVHLEGNPLTEDQVRETTRRFTRHLQKETSNGPTQKILNHLYTLFDSTPFAFPWTVNTVKKVHALLMKGVETDPTPGQMRDETEKDAATYGPDGAGYFIACPWSSVAEEMRNLTDWLASSPYDELITATLFFHEFESIHPFLDGNGRTGRTLFQLLLQMLGLRNCRLCKFEYEMLRDRERYYTLLAYTDSSQDYMPFIMYTAEAVLRAYKEAAERFSAKDRVKDLDEVSKILARQAKKVRCFTVAEATSWITGLGSEAVRSRLGALTSAGILTKEGNTRASRYFFRDPFAAVKTAVTGITAENNLRSSVSGGAAVDRSEKN